jgi:predicted nuclease with TOPRIM domain
MNTDFLIKLDALQDLSQLYEDNKKTLHDFWDYESELLNINKKLRGELRNGDSDCKDIIIKLNSNNTRIYLANTKSNNFKKTQDQLHKKLIEKQTDFYRLLLENTDLISKLSDDDYKKISNMCISSLTYDDYNSLKRSILNANSSATHTLNNLI